MSRDWARSGRHPFQIALLAVSFTAGLAGLALPTPGPSANMSAALGVWAPLLYLSLFVAAGLGLTGAFWRATDIRGLQVGLQIERAGMPLLAGSAGSYAAASFLTTGMRSLLAVLLIGGIALAALVRTRQITRDLEHVRAVIDHRPDDHHTNQG